MTRRKRPTIWLTGTVFTALVCSVLATAQPVANRRSTPASRPVAKPGQQDDSLVLHPPKDLALRYEGERKAQALTAYVEALDLQENGESEKALEAFEKVLNVDPGEVDLANRVAFLLTGQGDYPRAIDILKDAVKAQPNNPEPYLQLAYIYAKYLKKNGARDSLRQAGCDPRADRYRRLPTSLRSATHRRR